MKTATVGQTKSFEPVPAGNHVARFVQLINIGRVPTTWQGEERITHKIRATFELCNEKKEFKEGEGEKPYMVSREFTYTMAPKGHLRPFVEGFIGASLTDEEAEAFQLWDLLGKPCLLNVVHEVREGHTYANIVGVATLPKGMTAPEQVNESQLIDVDTITADELFALPEFLRKKIESSQEWKARQNPPATDEDIENSSPF